MFRAVDAATQKEFSDKVVIIAIDRAEGLDTAKKYSDSFYQSIGGFFMPETIFVNKNGEIVIHKRESMELQEIKEKIKQLIEQ